MTEPEFLDLLRRLPLHPGALDLRDDAARLSGEFVVTTDTLVEGVHFLATDPPGDVAWKLVAVNLSDLAAKGCKPEAVLLNYPLSDDAWDRAFVVGLGEALAAFDCPLLGGDTVSARTRVLTLTAFGTPAKAGVLERAHDTANAPAFAGARGAARVGDALYVVGPIGDAGAGLRIARSESGPPELLAAYRRPRPLLAEGQALAPHVHAMMDVSDGLLIDAARMAAASGLAVAIDLAAVPLSAAYRAYAGDDRNARIAAATAGDDYSLLFAGPADTVWPVAATRVGAFAAGKGLSLHDSGVPVELPASLGFVHTAPLA